MTVYIVDLEAVETRYTAQWKQYLPTQMKTSGLDVKVISGGDVPQATTPGAFLNFAGTNSYKSQQLLQIADMFAAGAVKAGDYFLYTDAWNPTVIQVKYMSELLGIPVKLGGMWHAGSYDPQDFLGRLIGSAKWVRRAEQSFFHAYDHNYFATQFHIDMFKENLLGNSSKDYLTDDKIVRSGWPMEYMHDTLLVYKNMPKRDLILFPHRIAPEKQVEIFRDLKEYLPQYEFVVCQEQQLTKNEYHNLLGEAKLVFSANLQETLGISWYEGAVVDAIPMVPDRLSYSEMAFDTFKYPSEWTESYEAYEVHRPDVVKTIIEHMENYQTRIPQLRKQTEFLRDNFFSAAELLNNIK